MLALRGWLKLMYLAWINIQISILYTHYMHHLVAMVSKMSALMSFEVLLWEGGGHHPFRCLYHMNKYSSGFPPGIPVNPDWLPVFVRISSSGNYSSSCVSSSFSSKDQKIILVKKIRPHTRHLCKLMQKKTFISQSLDEAETWVSVSDLYLVHTITVFFLFYL